MIRYVLVVALVVAILGVATVAVDHGATLRGESEAESAIERIETAAVDLHENEALPLAGDPPPQRVIEVTLPGEGHTSETPDHITFERASGENLTQVTYQFPGRAERSHVVAAPLVHDDGWRADGSGAGESSDDGSSVGEWSAGGPDVAAEQFRLDRYTGDVTLRLRLVADADGQPVVALTVEQ